MWSGRDTDNWKDELTGVKGSVHKKGKTSKNRNRVYRDISRELQKVQQWARTMQSTGERISAWGEKFKGLVSVQQERVQAALQVTITQARRIQEMKVKECMVRPTVIRPTLGERQQSG